MEGTTAPAADQGGFFARVADDPQQRARLGLFAFLAILVIVLIALEGLQPVAQRGLNGLSTGAIYALGAVGLTLVYGILKLVNFAHGDFLTFQTKIGLDCGT